MSEAGIKERDVLKALEAVKDPDLGRDIVSLGFIKDLSIEGSRVSFTIELTTPACPVKAELENAAKAAVKSLNGVQEVHVKMSSRVRSAMVVKEDLLPGVTNAVAVASGKGGVGKSTTAVNLALALEATGARVGLLDADIYGPSIPLMMGINERPSVKGKDRIIPVSSYGIKLMSMGFLVDGDSPLIWRGPMVHSAIKQFLGNVDWGELDYLLVDLPPGTGDAQLTMTQSASLSGAVIVTTPQDISLIDARKALRMFQKVEVPVLGIVENMSYFVCPHCGKETEIFNRGGGRLTSEKLEVPFLGEVPLIPEIREGSDTGRPIVAVAPDSPAAMAYRAIASKVAANLSIFAMAKETEKKKEWHKFIPLWRK